MFNIQLDKMKSEHHSLSQIQYQNLCSRIISIKDSGKSDKISEELTQLYKLLLWGDRYDSDFFQYFFEIKALDRLLQIFSKTTSKQVVVSIISFFNNLIPNLTQPETVNFLLSHPCILSLQNIKFLSLDNEIAEYYINFLCILSQKIDLNTLHMFFNRRYPTFPLLMQTARFYNHPQNLVRAKCRSILLSCLKLNSPKIKQFAKGFPFVTYYLHECNLLKEYWYVVDSILEFQGEKQFQLQNLESIFQDQKQLIMVIDDFIKIDPVNVATTFINAFANQCMAPLLQDLYSPNKINFNLKVVLLVSTLLVTNIHNPIFINFVIFCLFSKYYSSTICVKLMHPIEKPLSYSKKWKFKGFWDTYQNNINEYCVPTYFPNEKKIISDIYAESEDKKESTQIQYTKEMKSIFGMGTNFYDRETQKIEQLFAIPIHSNPQAFQRKSISQLMAEFMEKVKQDNINLNDLEQNPARQPLLSFLKSKDDILVMLTLHLLYNVITNKYVSHEVLDFCALSVNPKNYDFKSLSDIQTIMKCCFGILAFQPPHFRICTYKEAASVIEKLSEIYKGKIQKIPEDLIQIAKKALKQSVERLSQYIFAGKDWEKSLHIFNSVSLQNQKFKRKDLYTFGLLEKDATEINTMAAHQIYSIHPKHPDQIIARDFWLYIIVRDCYCKLTNTELKYQIVSCDEKAEKNASKFQIGTSYQIQSDHEIEGSYRETNTNDKNYTTCALIFLGGYFVIGVDKVVKYKSNYQECMMVMDKSDPSKIMLEINRRVISIQVENAKKAYEVRKYFQEMKTLMFKYQLSLLVKQTQWMREQAQSK